MVRACKSDFPGSLWPVFICCSLVVVCSVTLTDNPISAGGSKFMAWRRGYATRPPKVSSFSQFYPGNDERYVMYLTDVRWSVTETLIRTFERKRPVFHRKLPKTESLKDCMDRTIPYFRDNIVPNSINQGKRVLIASSENAIRGLLMHLCDIPEERISEVRAFARESRLWCSEVALDAVPLIFVRVAGGNPHWTAAHL